MDFDNFDDLLINIKKKYKLKTNFDKLQKENNDMFYQCMENYYKIAQAWIMALFLKHKDIKPEELINEIIKHDQKLKEYMYDCMKDM